MRPSLASRARLYCAPQTTAAPKHLAGEFPPGVVGVRKGTASETDYIKVMFPDLAKEV